MRRMQEEIRERREWFEGVFNNIRRQTELLEENNLLLREILELLKENNGQKP